MEEKEPIGTPDDETIDYKAKFEESNAKLQETMAELAKQKRATDKASAEAADFKKKYRETLSESELEKEKKSAEEERIKALERENTIFKRIDDFIEEGFSAELAKQAAIADVDGERETLHKLRKENNEAQRKAWETEFLKSRPEVSIGGSGGKAITKEQFDNMSVMERSALYEKNRAEYDRLNAL